MIGHEPIFHREGTPVDDGLYVAEVYFGWKILAWCDGEWWHAAHVGRWTASEPIQWVGPLPEHAGTKPKQEYDL